jgi:hypothetical protein
MIGPPFLKLSTKKFLSKAPSGEALAVGEAEGDPLAVVVAGDIAVVAGVVPGIGERPGAVGLAPGAVTAVVVVVAGAVAGEVAGAVVVVVAGAVAAAAGLVAVVGGAPGARFAGEVAGGGWPNEVRARVTVERLAISSVFIGLIGKFCRARFPMSRVSSSRT